MGWVMVAMINGVCYVENDFFSRFFIKQAKGLVALLVHVILGLMAWQQWCALPGRKKGILHFHHNTWLRTLLALQEDTRPWLSFHNNMEK